MYVCCGAERTHQLQHLSGEGETEFHESTHSLEYGATTEETVSETVVQEIVVCSENVINGGGSMETLHEARPVGLNDLHCHVVLQALDKVEHSVEEGKSQCVPEGGEGL